MNSPKYLNRRAKAIFQKTQKHLEDRGIWDDADTELVAAYAQAVAAHEEATAIIDKEGMIYTDGNSQKRKHPLIIAQRSYAEQAAKLGKQIGLLQEGRDKIKKEDKERPVSKLALLRTKTG